MQPKRLLSAMGLGLILAVGALMRLPNLRTVPAWYPDEGSWVTVAAELLRGQSAYMAFGRSSLIAGRPPLFHWLLAGWFSVTGVDIFWARLLTVSLGLLTLVLLYLVVERMAGTGAALSASAFYAVYPAAAVYQRMALTYHLLAPCYVLAIFGLWRLAQDRRRRWIVLAALCAGLGLLTDWVAVSLLAFVVLSLGVIRPRALLWAVPLALSPFFVWCAATWAASGDAFIHDLAFTFSRTQAPLALQVARIVFYRTTLEGDVWLTLGGLGLLLQSERRQRWLTAGLLGLTLLVVARNGPAVYQASYFLIPLLPLAAWGVGLLVARGVPILVGQLETAWQSVWPRAPHVARVLTSLILFLLVLAPVLSMIAEGTLMNYGLYLSRMGDTLADPATAEQSAEYVNARTTSEDVVLVSPTIAWLFHAHVADFQMAVAATGKATSHFPADIPPDRFRFDPRLENAKYVIIDPLWRGWASAQMPEVAEIIRQVESGWKQEMRFGRFEIYRQPPR